MVKKYENLKKKEEIEISYINDEDEPVDSEIEKLNKKEFLKQVKEYKKQKLLIDSDWNYKYIHLDANEFGY